MPKYVRREAGKVVAFANRPQSGWLLERLADDHPDLLEYLDKINNPPYEPTLAEILEETLLEDHGVSRGQMTAAEQRLINRGGRRP